jgi:hypothetical protein
VSNGVVVPSDRRKSRRFPIALEVRYRIKSAIAGSGEVSDISSDGVRFHADRVLPVGKAIEVSLPWPFLLEGRCRLQLRMRGRIVRSNAMDTAVAINNYEFRTVSSHLADNQVEQLRVSTLRHRQLRA